MAFLPQSRISTLIGSDRFSHGVTKHTTLRLFFRFPIVPYHQRYVTADSELFSQIIPRAVRYWHCTTITNLEESEGPKDLPDLGSYYY